MDYMVEFARRLKRQRETLNLTQAQLADKIGVSSQTISAYEKNSGGEKGKTPTLDKVIALAKELEVSLDFLCGLEERPTKEVHIENMADVVDYLSQIPKYFGPFDCYIGTKEIDLDEEECYPKPDEYGGDSDIWVTTTLAATITIKNSMLSDFFSKRNKMYRLREDNVIDEDIYNSWLQAEIEKLRKWPVLALYANADYRAEVAEK